MRGACHASVNVICFESCVLYSSGVILFCVRGRFPWRFMGGRFPKWIVSFLISQKKKVFSLGHHEPQANGSSNIREGSLLWRDVIIRLSFHHRVDSL